MTARPHRHLDSDAGALVDALKAPQAVLLTGATGFIGSRLAQALTAAGHDLIVLTRDPRKAAALPPPFRLITSLDQLPARTPIDVVINLAGEPIADGIWTRSRRRRILASRLRLTQRLVRLIARLERPPKVLISGSAVGWYGRWQDEALTEFDGGKSGFTHRVCEAWEQAARRAQRCGVRVIRLRIGLVLAREGGWLRGLLLPFKCGLGGTFGSGAQWVSWIERDDLVRLIAHGIANAELIGPVNATAPEPVRNATFMRALGRALHRPAIWRFPAALLHALAGDLADELLLAGQQVLPAKVLASGFAFRHPTLPDALAGIFGARSTQGDAPAQPQTASAVACLDAPKPASTAAAPAEVAAPELDSAGATARALERMRRQG
jgi:uncharacterized protein (TIGR01777 family)